MTMFCMAWKTLLLFNEKPRGPLYFSNERRRDVVVAAANWRWCDVLWRRAAAADAAADLCDVQADDLLVMREQNYQLGRDNSRLRRRLAELQKVSVEVPVNITTCVLSSCTVECNSGS